LLKLLNSNTENPNLIWDNGTRGEIMKYLGEEQERKISTVNMGEREGRREGGREVGG
jgi:DnaJ family protein C protein 13